MAKETETGFSVGLYSVCDSRPQERFERGGEGGMVVCDFQTSPWLLCRELTVGVQK